jgi:hypothetical protein
LMIMIRPVFEPAAGSVKVTAPAVASQRTT